jgi:hypothetical protein
LWSKGTIATMDSGSTPKSSSVPFFKKVLQVPPISTPSLREQSTTATSTLRSIVRPEGVVDDIRLSVVLVE